MNSYTKILKESLTEIDKFSSTDAGKQMNNSWYSVIKNHIMNASEARTDSEAEYLLSIVLRILVDSGPMTVFSQALETAFASVQAKEKKNKINK
jgi:hypothetical protein